MPKVSVVIPLYNRRDYIADCIQSVLEQDFADFEIVVVDDGSTDGSDEVIAGLKDSRIRYYRNETNRGISYTRNRLNTLASGSYIAILDSDDLAEPGRLTKQVNFLDLNPEVSLLGGCAKLIDEHGVSLGRTWGRELRPEEVFANLPFENPILQSTVMARREYFLELPYREDLRTAEDYDIWLRGSHRHRYAVTKDVVTAYRIHAGNISLEQGQAIKRNAVELRRAYLSAIAGIPIADAALNGILDDLSGPGNNLYPSYKVMNRLLVSAPSGKPEFLHEWQHSIRRRWHRCIYRVKEYRPSSIPLLAGALSAHMALSEKLKYTLRCLTFQKNPIMHTENLRDRTVYDIGFHTGQDTEYYLEKGYRVVAVDADPSLIEEGKRKFMKSVASGQLLLVNRAIFEEDEREVDFFVAGNSEWSSLVQEFAGRNNQATKAIKVRTTRLDSLFREYGKPYFCKIDIEGYDLRALGTLNQRDAPPFLSVEAVTITDAHKPGEKEITATLDELKRLGYQRFRLIDQTHFAPMLPGVPFFGVDRFGNDPIWVKVLRKLLFRKGYRVARLSYRDWIKGRCGHDFEFGSAGPLPEQLPGSWLNYEQARRAILYHVDDAIGRKHQGFWADWHATR